MVRGVALCLSFAWIGACSAEIDPGQDAGVTDGGVDGVSMDATVRDGGLSDGSVDGGTTDAGPSASCGDIECRFCVSRGACVSPIDDCALEALPVSDECANSFSPCDIASCWEPTLSLPMCGARVVDEDFSSGRFNVHRYDATVPGGEALTLTLSRTGGVFRPLLIITEAAGELVFAGDPVTLRPSVMVLSAEVSDEEVTVTVQLDSTRMLSLWVTDADVAAGDFAVGVDTSALYRLSARQMCEGGSISESVGSTNGGSLENAAQLTDGDGYVVADTGRNASYGTQETIDFIRAGFAAVRARHPDAATVQVRDLSVENGGRPSGPWPHASHQSGRDVDMTYHLDSCDGVCPIADVPLSQFDEEATWTLFEYWLSQDAVTFIFADRALQEILYDTAGRRGATSEELDHWFQYPSREARGIVRHEPNHLNHHHVRFVCPVDDARCVD